MTTEETTSDEATTDKVVETVTDAPAEAAETPVAEAVAEVIPTKVTEVRAGQTVRIHERIKDVTPKGEVRERIQIFEGIVLGIKGAGVSRTLTVRKISSGGFGVEKIYPVNSPVIAKIELVKTAKVRRAKLAFLQDKKNIFKRKLKETYEVTTKKKKKK